MFIHLWMEETRKFKNILLAKQFHIDSILKSLLYRKREKVWTLLEGDILIDILLLRLYVLQVIVTMEYIYFNIVLEFDMLTI